MLHTNSKTSQNSKSSEQIATLVLVGEKIQTITILGLNMKYFSRKFASYKLKSIAVDLINPYFCIWDGCPIQTIH